MADMARMRHAAPVMIMALALIAALGIAEGKAQEAPELFSAVPPDTEAPGSLNARDAYSTGSEMVVLNTDALTADALTATIMNQTYVISRDLVETWKDGIYTWHGSDGQGASAILVVDGTAAIGMIRSQAGTFEILPVSGSIHEIYSLDMSAFPPIGDLPPSAAGGARSSPIDRDLISQLESAYIGWMKYDDGSTGMVTIDVYVAVTEKAVDDYMNATSFPHVSEGHLARLAVDDANRAYKTNDLPIRLNLVDRDTPDGYVDAGNVKSDLANLMDADHPSFRSIHADIEEANADVVVMLVGDYRHPEDDNRDKENTCGMATQLLAGDASTAFGAVESVCLAAESFTGVVGRLQGAGYNVEQETVLYGNHVR